MTTQQQSELRDCHQSADGRSETFVDHFASSMHWYGTASLIVWTLLLYRDAVAIKASDIFKICSRNNPQLNDCVKQSIMDVLPKLKSGIPELEMPSIDPLFIPTLSLTQGSGPVSMDANFTNLYIHGISKSDVKQVNVDLDNYRLDLEMAVQFLLITANYTISGRILVLPITGHGDSWANYTGVSGTGSMIGHQESRDGKEYMKLDQFNFSIDPKRAVIHFNNLFNGNKGLGNIMNQLMSSNWEVVFREMKPVIDKTITNIFTDIASKVFDRFSFAELFPVD